MNDAIEVSGEKMRQIKRRTEVNPDWAIHLHDGDLLAPDLSLDIFWKLVRVVMATIPHGSPDYLPGRSG